MPDPTLRVSEHAALRYCERVLGFDRKAPEVALQQEFGAEDGRYKLTGQPIVAIVKNKTVVTFVPDVPLKELLKPKKKRPKRHRELAEAGHHE